MGTVVGAIIVYTMCSKNSVLNPLIFETKSGTLDANLLLLLVGYGITFCYVASAPILVLHTSRFAIQAGNVYEKTKLKEYIKWLNVPLLIAPLLYLWFDPNFTVCKFVSHEYASDSYFRIFYFTITCILIWAQYLAIFYTMENSENLFKFYENLADKRAKAKSDFIDSYKHLREHGNSFLIVFMEILLALALETVTPFQNTNAYIMIIILWIMPAAGVWFVGTSIERKLADRS